MIFDSPSLFIGASVGTALTTFGLVLILVLARVLK
jgi:hypothetical protein